MSSKLKFSGKEEWNGWNQFRAGSEARIGFESAVPSAVTNYAFLKKTGGVICDRGHYIPFLHPGSLCSIVYELQEVM